MSDFDFRLEGMRNVPDLGVLVNKYIEEEYGEDALVAGHLAFDDDRNLIDIRVYVTGTLDRETKMGSDAETPHGDQREAWDDFVAWMAELGVSHTMTFYRRPPFLGTVEPKLPDIALLNATGPLCDNVDIAYHGHIITDGTRHALLMDDPHDHEGNDMERMLNLMPPEIKQAMGKALADKAREMGAILPPSVEATLELLGKEPGTLTQDELATVIEAMGELQNLTLPEDENAGLSALRNLEAKLDTGYGAQAGGPMDVPDITERPKVPKAFYN